MTKEQAFVDRIFEISIHMPHTWHDYSRLFVVVIYSNISIHMPHTWHDRLAGDNARQGDYFNPHATYVA